MSRILIHTMGSAGDFNPFIALAIELQKRGHDVHFAVNPSDAAKINAIGVSATGVGPDVDWDSDLMKRMLVASASKPIEILFRDALIPNIRTAYETLLPFFEDVDLFLCHVVQLAAPALAYHTRVPWVTIMPATSCYPTAEQPPPGIAWRGCPPALCRAGWAAAKAVFRPLDKLANEQYRQLGLPPRENVLVGGSYSQLLTLGLWSPTFYPRPSDWPDWFQVSGYARWDGPPPKDAPSVELPPGDAPLITFTLGSSVVNHPGRFYEIALEAIANTPYRALLLGAPSDLEVPEALRGRVKCVRYAPYGEVFPQSQALVHQGGVGTTQAACYYGIPALIVPRGFDQFENAAHVQRDFLGLRVFPADFSPALLRLRLERLLNSERIARSVEDLGRKMRAEPGVERSAEMLEELLDRTSRRRHLTGAC